MTIPAIGGPAPSAGPSPENAPQTPRLNIPNEPAPTSFTAQETREAEQSIFAEAGRLQPESPRTVVNVEEPGEGNGGHSNGPSGAGDPKGTPLTAEQLMDKMSALQDKQLAEQIENTMAESKMNHELKMVEAGIQGLRAESNLVEKVANNYAEDSLTQLKASHDAVSNAASA